MPIFSVSIVGFEQINVGWDTLSTSDYKTEV